jgi:hypothetical protein
MRVLPRRKSFDRPLMNISSFLRPVKDDLGLKTSGVRSIRHKYDQICVVETSWNIIGISVSFIWTSEQW